MPGWGGTGPAMGTSKLMARLANNTITKDDISASAGRVLQAMFSVGLMDMPNGSFAPAKLQPPTPLDATVVGIKLQRRPRPLLLTVSEYTDTRAHTMYD